MDEGIDRFVREHECKLLTGLGRTTRWRLERQGRFPKRHSISENATAWLLSDIQRWIRERTGQRDAA